ncbi:MAG: DUF4416 family protein [Sphaerochaetaceae bacterium]
MGQINPFVPSLLVIGVLSTNEEAHGELLQKLVEKYGPLEEESEHTPFSYTDYYDSEMGGSPLRYFLVFKTLVDPSRLAQIKIETNNLEQVFSREQGRTINLDPGILSASSLILATTKNRSHRIPLHSGIYAEVTLIYYNHKFNSLPWTYADYKSEAFCTLFKKYRTSYMTKLKQK